MIPADDLNTDPWDELGHGVGLEMLSLLSDAHNRGVQIQIVTNNPGSTDTARLQAQGYVPEQTKNNCLTPRTRIAEVQLVNVPMLLGSGTLHAKFIVGRF